MQYNINTTFYWNSRFSSGDWEDKGGRVQTAFFAKAQVQYFLIPDDFDGTIVDFGCGLGDAMPIYRARYRKAKLVGVDISDDAIAKCRVHYGHIAEFICGDYSAVPQAEVVITSNVLEHLSDDLNVASSLQGKCDALYITVPFMEWPLGSEHVRTYDEDYFRSLGSYSYVVFPSRGWSEYTGKLALLQTKNVIRKLLGREVVRRRKQIMFRLAGR